jgi:hypothetical protein
MIITLRQGIESADYNRTLIQKLIDSEIDFHIPKGRYYYNGALLHKSNVSITLDNNAVMILDQSKGFPVGFNQWPLYSNILMGAWNKSNIDLLTTSPLKAGQSVWICSLSTFNVGESVVPKEGQLNIVESIEPLTFVYPVTISNYEVVALSDNENNIVGTGIPQFMAHNAHIQGGTWINNTSQGAFSTCTGIGCTVDVDKIIARNGIGYGNLNAYSLLKCREMHVKRSAVELAMNSHDNHVQIHYVNCYGDSQVSQGLVWINEASRNNIVDINTARSLEPHLAAVRIDAASNNKIIINSLHAPNVKRLINESPSDFTVDKQETTGNKVYV